MLVLSRKKQESILIGQDIEITVLALSGNRVRLGFRCPGHLSIRREELSTSTETGEAESVEQEEELACS